MPRPLSQEEMQDLLRTATHGHFGCAFRDRVYVVPMSFGYDDKHLYVFTHTGKKTDYMLRNPWVCLTVDEVVNPDCWRSVVVDGTVEFLEGEADTSRAAGVILAQQGQPDTDPATLGDRWGGPEGDEGLFLCVHIREITGRAEHWPPAAAT
jgi:nitroimidazol reductase NimA-like FMN-containing flavoprotein (pyridoxamine 5'-phosphate oxidase superfamily)